MQGKVRPARRPIGWKAPGPRPGPPPAGDLLPGPDEDLCHLTGDWRILQRTDGHRWSLDDLVTAWWLRRNVPSAPRRIVDLGCGIGSVLLMNAWSFPGAEVDGVEAQEVSVGLARRSIRINGCEPRVRVMHGDLRNPDLTRPLVGADAVTGTPPYFAMGTHTISAAIQREPCRAEVRGGLEDYLAAATRLVSPDGVIVLVGAWRQAERSAREGARQGWPVVRRCVVTPREGKEPLIFVDAYRRRAQGSGSSAAGEALATAGGASSDALVEVEHLTVRDKAGQWTPAFSRVRDDMGLPPLAEKKSEDEAGSKFPPGPHVE